MVWYYEDKPIESVDLDKHFAFVYSIENKLNGKKYIGKKLLKHRKTKQVKGKRKRILVESDWREYYGSNKKLLEDVEKLGKENFRRTILKWCSTKGEASYWEIYEQMINHAILREDYYNEFVGVKINSSHVKNVKAK